MSGTSPSGDDAARAWLALVAPDEIGTLHRTADLLTLVQLRDWPVDPDVLWVALTRAEPLAAWLGRPDADLGPGVEVAVAQGSGEPARVTVAEWQPGSRLLLEWLSPGEGVAWVDLAIGTAPEEAAPELAGAGDAGEASRVDRAPARTRLRLSYVAEDEAQVRSAAVAWLSFLDVLGEITGAVRPPEDSTPALRGIERLAIAAQLIGGVHVQG